LDGFWGTDLLADCETISEETSNIVRLDSTAMIKSQGLLGDKFVELSFGSPEASRLKGGEVLKSILHL
jgi:ABC-type transporter Mla subunit MlaD